MDHSLRHSRFRALLRNIREEARLSQAELAAKLGRPQTFVSKAELSERRIDFLETLDFCAACNVPVNQLMTRLRQAGLITEAKGRPIRRGPRKTTTGARVRRAGE
jgi:transcriptional regulator with XRE-family HTH domain